MDTKTREAHLKHFLWDHSMRPASDPGKQGPPRSEQPSSRNTLVSVGSGANSQVPASSKHSAVPALKSSSIDRDRTQQYSTDHKNS